MTEFQFVVTSRAFCGEFVVYIYIYLMIFSIRIFDLVDVVMLIELENKEVKLSACSKSDSQSSSNQSLQTTNGRTVYCVDLDSLILLKNMTLLL